jgi:pimeloyl-ACP methyl ester carboxylesterase
MDRRGRGLSGDTAPYSIEREAEDIRAVVRHAGEHVTLLGHSYGALCAIEAALQLTVLRRLILYEPPLAIGSLILSRGVREELERLVSRGDREGALIYFFGEVVGVPEAELDALKMHPVWPARVAAAHTIVRESNEEERSGSDLDRLRALSVPTLLLLGGESPPAFGDATGITVESKPIGGVDGGR